MPGRFSEGFSLRRLQCIETRYAQRFLLSRPVKTDRNDAGGIAEMMRLGYYRPVHVKSLAAQSMRTTLAVRMQLVASQLQIEGTIRGLLKIYGLKHTPQPAVPRRILVVRTQRNGTVNKPAFAWVSTVSRGYQMSDSHH